MCERIKYKSLIKTKGILIILNKCSDKKKRDFDKWILLNDDKKVEKRVKKRDK